jgi:serine protease Do
VGFAVPSNTARKIYTQLVTAGSVQRGAIGVSFQNVNNPSVLRSFGAEYGVVVNSVEPGSPAERAGLKRGDVITTVNGKPIHQGDELVGIVSETEIGKKLKVEVLRERKRMTLDVEVSDRNKTFTRLRGTPDDEDADEATEEAGGVFGISVRSDQRAGERCRRKLNLTGPQGSWSAM